VFILEHYFASKSFAAVREEFSSAYPDKEVPNKTTIQRLVTEFWDTGSVCYRKHVWNPTVLTGGTLRKVEETLKKKKLICLLKLMPPKLTDTVVVGVAFYMKHSVHSIFLCT
jgi:hypothetical protein